MWGNKPSGGGRGDAADGLRICDVAGVFKGIPEKLGRFAPGGATEGIRLALRFGVVGRDPIAVPPVGACNAVA